MNFNSKRTKCSAKSFFMVLILLKIKKIHFISVKDQFEVCKTFDMCGLLSAKGELMMGTKKVGALSSRQKRAEFIILHFDIKSSNGVKFTL